MFCIGLATTASIASSVSFIVVAVIVLVGCVLAAAAYVKMRLYHFPSVEGSDSYTDSSASRGRDVRDLDEELNERAGAMLRINDGFDDGIVGGSRPPSVRDLEETLANMEMEGGEQEYDREEEYGGDEDYDDDGDEEDEEGDGEWEEDNEDIELQSVVSDV